MNGTPYLSIVGWTRNDGYTLNYAQRLEHAIGFLVRQLERYKIPSEIIIVEWNPPPDRPLMVERFRSFQSVPNVTLRFITVPSEHHQGLIGGDVRGMHNSYAANAGIRRARGRFVLPKPLDTYYSDQLVSRIASTNLDEHSVYRCDRVDAKPDDEDWIKLSDQELLIYLESHRVHRNERLTHSIDWKIRDLHTNASGDFMLMTAAKWAQIRGFPRDPTVLCLDGDSIALHAAAAYGAREVHWQEEWVYKIAHSNTYAERTKTVWKDWQRSLDGRLLSKGWRELAFNLRVWLNYPRRQVRGLENIYGPSIERNFVAKAARHAKNDVSIPTNDTRWGLGGVQLQDQYVTRAEWDQK